MLRNILRRLHHAKEIGFALVALLAISQLPLPAHATVSEKFPTETTQIVAGWNNPTYLYAHDEIFADCSTNNAEQSYSGFGFNFSGAETIERVYLKTDFYLWATSDWENMFYSMELSIGRGTLPIDAWLDSFIMDGVGAYVGDFYVFTYHVVVDVTAKVAGNMTLLNNFSIKVLFQLWTLSASAYMDFLSIEVCYSTETESELPIGLAIGGLFAGFVGVIVFAIRKKR